MQKQLARPLRLVIEAMAHRVFRDIAVDQPDLAIVDLGIRLFQARLARAQALDLGPGEDQATLQSVKNLVFVKGAPVSADRLNAFRFLVFFFRSSHDSALLSRMLAQSIR